MNKKMKFLSLILTISIIMGLFSIQALADEEYTDFRISQYVLEDGQYIEKESLPSNVELDKNGEQWILQEFNVAGFYKLNGIDKVYPQSQLNIVQDESSENGIVNIIEDNTIQILKPGKAVISFEFLRNDGSIIDDCTITIICSEKNEEVDKENEEEKELDQKPNEENEEQEIQKNEKKEVDNETQVIKQRYKEENGEHNYDFDIWIWDVDDKEKIGLLRNEEIIMEKANFDSWEFKTLELRGYYTDIDSEEKHITSRGLNCEVICDEGVAKYTEMRSWLTIYEPGKITLKFTTPNYDFLASEDDPLIIELNVKGSSIKEEFEVKVIEKPNNLEPGMDVNIKASANNTGIERRNILLIVGLYNQDNEMLNYSYCEKEVLAGKSLNLGAGFKIPKDSLEYEVRIFVWDNWDDRNAISDVERIPIK